MQERLITFIMRSNWIIFAVIIAIALAVNISRAQMAGLIAGGLIATINFHLLYRSLKRSVLNPEKPSKTSVILGKYYIRFVISGAIIFFLISGQYVHPVGLCIGLSIVVASIFIATIMEAKKLLNKEAI
jgi:hypothetical protein